MKKEELLKERNDLAKQFALAGHDITTCVSMANRLMDDMYGNVTKGLLIISADKAKEFPKGEQGAIILNEHQDGISIYTDENDEKWVRVKIYDEDFLIAAQDLDNGKESEWQKAMDRLKEVGKTTFNKKQIYLIAAFIDEINEKLREIGGKKLDKAYWSSTEYYSGSAWLVSFSSGFVYSCAPKCVSCVVRPVAASKS